MIQNCLSYSIGRNTRSNWIPGRRNFHMLWGWLGQEALVLQL